MQPGKRELAERKERGKKGRDSWFLCRREKRVKGVKGRYFSRPRGVKGKEKPETGALKTRKEKIAAGGQGGVMAAELLKFG